jgi:hypothetical protein
MPFLGVDAEVLADIQEFSRRKLRTLVRERPLAWMGGALATGFLLGGGWKTRVGRLILLAGVRYAAVNAAGRYFNE